MSLSRSMTENKAQTAAAQARRTGIPIMIGVSSSNIARIGHANGELHVHFRNGGKGVYEGVTDGRYHEMMIDYQSGGSLGGFIAKHIKPHHPYRKL